MFIEGEAVSAAILSGGAARRAGGINKSFMRPGGRAIIDLQLEGIRPAFGDRVFVVTDRPEDYAPLGLRCVSDAPVPGLKSRASLRGLLTALERSPTPWVFALACDMPFPDPQLMPAARIGASGASGSAESITRGVCLRGAQGPEPFHSLYHRDLIDRLRRRLEAAQSNADLSLRAWIADEPRILVADPPPGCRTEFRACFQNFNDVPAPAAHLAAPQI